MMKISEFCDSGDEIIEDAIFSSVGHLYGKNENRLVPIHTSCELNRALVSEKIAGLIIPDTIPVPSNTGKGIVLSSNPVKTGLMIQKRIIKNSDIQTLPARIHQSANIHPTAFVSEHNVSIGKKVQIHENVIIHAGSVIDDYCIIGPNTVIGLTPYQVECDPTKDCQPLGSVEVKPDVVIHANCCIERPWFQDTTIIGRRCQIDNRVTIRQGAVIDDFSLITANSEIGEYAAIGKDCWIGLRSSIHPGVHIGDSCYVTLGSRVTREIGRGMVVKDNWAIKRERFRGIIT